MFLREYLYVDLDKVSGLASQLYDGIPERATEVSARQKKAEINLRLAHGGSSSSSEDSIERSLGDSLFKELESDLESLGLLRDVSEALANKDSWSSLGDRIAPGQILRLTANGTLFHPTQMTDAIIGMATAAHGIAELMSSDEDEKDAAASGSKQKTKRPTNRELKQIPAQPVFPEDMLPSGKTVPFLGVPRTQLSGMIKVVRGIFGEGMHLQLRPAGPKGPIVSSRLEQGRRFLDSSPEVLSSRYGLAEQEWTVVGMVGQLGIPASKMTTDSIMNPDDSVNRAKFVDLVGEFFGQTNGLVDLPKAPGFSVIPLAVYRAIGDSISAELE